MERDVEAFVGEQLRLARIAWGLSLEEVGQAVQATRQYIQQLETGAKKPNSDMVAALADVLGIEPLFLRSHIRSSVKPEQCHFRKQMTTPVSVTSLVLARGSILDRLAGELDRLLRLPTVNFPDIPISAPEEIERAAEETRRHWGLGADGPIISMMRVVENAGAVVTCLGGISERVDALSMDRPRPIIVRSAAKESLCRLRFDLAHETGHLVMHRGLQTGDRETEDQANRFASAFLLPRFAFLREFPRGRTLNWTEIFNMKLRWKVAARAIVRRAYDLGAISAAQYRTANIHLVKSGQAKCERYDDQLPMEPPELFDAALDKLERSKPGSTRALARSMGLGERLFEMVAGRKLPEDGVIETGNIIRFPARG
ncbi:helix-turn-helix domain-containing protein [Magnetospirillum aberrantis]|uniref:ImmA/IrrE family metallo-endopeptidase n=1 Tax=Magnetospirillum aberrantis SpK TaxID=908842 RepID=A0A7C9QUW5_9PROT|nr:XRE family transcriptional regulator [Magnetospirillum aberrantis]NFV79876.1 ImmA/IrrE family metallo-endopeptidase [Magnetospirillum aberrantis SpK]